MRSLNLAVSVLTVTLMAAACGQTPHKHSSRTSSSAPQSATLSDDSAALTSTTKTVSGTLSALTIVDSLNTKAPLHGARVGFVGGSIAGTGPNGGTEVSVNFTTSVSNNSCTTRSADLCSTAGGYFKSCLSESLRLCADSGGNSTVNVRFFLPEIAASIHGFYRDLLGRPNTPEEEQNWLATGSSRSANGVASELINSAEGRRERLILFFQGFTPAGPTGLSFTEADLSRGVALFAAGRNELQVFSTMLRSKGRKPAVLTTGNYLRTIVKQNYSRLLHRAPKKAEMNNALTVLAKTPIQAQITLSLVSGNEYLEQQH